VDLLLRMLLQMLLWMLRLSLLCFAAMDTSQA
jgi:hypothetical protein